MPSMTFGNATLTGRLMVNPGGYAFVQPRDQDESVFIPPGAFNGALDGDTVEITSRPSPKGMEGRVVEIVERRRVRLVGTLRKAGRRRWIVEVDDPRILQTVSVEGPGPAIVGEAVAVRIDEYPTPSDPGTIHGTVERSLGTPGTLPTEVAKILVEHNIDDEFPADVAHEAMSVPTQVVEADLERRADLRHLPFMTIDPDDARDFDDAVCMELLGNSEDNDDMRLWVAVADVSHYVREGTSIDREAQHRSFSLYLPNRAIPMLPEQLSTHMCSLVPEQDRLAMVVSMIVDAGGGVRDIDVMAAVIHSRKRLTYGQVARELEGAGKLDAEVVRRIERLRRLADRLRAARLRRGAVELSLPETKILLDEDDPDRIRDVVRSRSSPSMARAYNLIEELMLAANEGVASLASARNLPVPFRVHDKPDEEKLGMLAMAAASLGVRVDPDKLQHPRGVQKFLTQIEGRAQAQALNMLMLRAMAQAEYRTENLGHFALASRAYLHFTSPIRRYPDLVAHRVMKAWLRRRKDGQCGPEPVPRMPTEDATSDRSRWASDREREVAQAERDAKALFAAAYMLDRVGDRFEGTVSGMSNNGVFVTLDQPFVDGMIRVAQINRALRDNYQLEETGIRLVSERSGNRISVGDRLVVEVEAASLARRQVDLAFIAMLRA